MSGTQYQIVVVRPENFIYVESWREAIDALRIGFEEIGMVAPVVENRIAPGAIPIVFGAHHLTPEMEDKLPANTIIYNLEQLLPGYPWHSPRYLALLSRFSVWDFHQRNIEQLRCEGLNFSARHVPVGYVPQMSSIVPGTEDVDVLFYGLLTERRQAVLKKLAAHGLNVIALRGVFGAERDAWIARSKVVINLHQKATGYFEALRVLHLMANRKAVVTECAAPGEIDHRLLPGLCAVPYDQLADACLQLVQDEQRRCSLAEAALYAARHPELRMSTILRTALFV